MSEMDRDPDGVLLMILDIQKIYRKYLDKVNKTDN